MSPRKQSAQARRSLGRLERILLLVPYCVRNPGVAISELAERLDATEQEILEDLNLLFVCGLPDYTPADLMEVFIDEDRVFIRMADYFDRPLRLTRTEAIPLYLKGQALVNLLADGTGVTELAPLRSGLEKLSRSLLPHEGGVAELTKRIKVQLESGEARWLGLLREAVTEHRSAEVEYYTYSRDSLTRRRIDPYLVFASLGHWYVSGYCHLAQDRRMFRLDRIKSLDLTEESFEPPADGGAELPPPLIYVPSADDVRVKLRVAASIAQWFAELHPVESSRDLADGRKELVFRTAAFPWLEKLLLRFGADVEVVEPVELAKRLRGAAGRILELYEPKKTERRAKGKVSR